MPPPTRHSCLIYNGSPSGHLTYLMTLLALRLKMHHRCMFLGSPEMVAGAFSALSAAQIDVVEEMKKGSLILTSDRDYLRGGLFDPATMLALLESSVDQALKDGFQGLWATGDMNWEFGSEKNLPKLLEYECGLEKLFRKKPELDGICQYSQHTLPPYILGHALLTHPGVFVNETRYGINLSYTDPEQLLKSPPPRRTKADLEAMFHLLQAA